MNPENTLLGLLTGGRYMQSSDLPTARQVGSSAIDKIIESDNKRRGKVLFESGKNIFGKPTEEFTQGDLDNLVMGLISPRGALPKSSKVDDIIDKIKNDPHSPIFLPRTLPVKERAEFYGKTIGQAQRGKPEEAMVKVQKELGGGVLSAAIEPMGDIFNRMYSYAGRYPGSIGVAKEKINRVLSYLKHPYGFAKEHKENVISNARFSKVPVKEYEKNVNKALKEYGKAHSELPAHHNEVQRLIKEANEEFARQNWNKVVENLEIIKGYMDEGVESFTKRILK
jgi:hypothetical protein